ncbi:hypothetical protein [Pelagovum pacificum]|nr:hypothetical protein [Pelagovum pacificum]
MKACAAMLCLLPALATAEPLVRDCDSYIANARNLSRPFDQATREFANGEVAILSLLLDEPACCGAHLMVTYPDPYEGFAQCRLVTTADEMGYASFDLVSAQAAYDPATGLVLSLPARQFDGSDFAPLTVEVTVNRAVGEVYATERR